MLAEQPEDDFMDLRSYIDVNGLWGEHGFAALDWLGHELTRGVDFRGGDVLEIGAGEGLLSLWFLYRGARSVVSLEPEAEGSTTGVARRAAAHRRALAVPEARWRYLPQTLQSYRPDRAFRLAFSRASVNHLDEEACIHLRDSEAARRVYRDLFGRVGALLEPDGVLVLTDSARDNYWRRMGLASPWAPEIEWHKHQEPETWAALLDQAGLRPVASRWHHNFFRLRRLGPLLRTRPVARLTGSSFVLVARRAQPEFARGAA